MWPHEMSFLRGEEFTQAGGLYMYRMTFILTYRIDGVPCLTNYSNTTIANSHRVEPQPCCTNEVRVGYDSDSDILIFLGDRIERDL